MSIVRVVAFIYGLILPAAMLCLALAHPAIAGQESPDQASFFSGVVTDLTAEKVTVSRTILGKEPEKRTFAIHPDTKIEGKLKNKSRVTVRFAPAEDGEIAVSIVVRDKADKKKP